MLKHLRRVFIQFTPSDPRATTARELLQRLGNDKARASNPACVVQFNVDEAGPSGSAFVDLVFNDGEERRVMTADARIADVVRTIEQKATEMEMLDVIKETKYDPWQPDTRVQTAGATALLNQHMSREIQPS